MRFTCIIHGSFNLFGYFTLNLFHIFTCILGEVKIWKYIFRWKYIPFCIQKYFQQWTKTIWVFIRWTLVIGFFYFRISTKTKMSNKIKEDSNFDIFSNEHLCCRSVDYSQICNMKLVSFTTILALFSSNLDWLGINLTYFSRCFQHLKKYVRLMPNQSQFSLNNWKYFPRKQSFLWKYFPYSFAH